MMANYHINGRGEPRSCSARPGNCPFGSVDDHYSSAEEAMSAFESKMADATFVSHSRDSAPAQGLNSTTLEDLKPRDTDTLVQLEDRQNRAERFAREGDNETFLQASEIALAIDRRMTEMRGQAQALKPIGFADAGSATHSLATSGGSILAGLPQQAYEPAIGRQAVSARDSASANSALDSFFRRHAA